LRTEVRTLPSGRGEGGGGAPRRGLLALVSKRRRLINYLHSRDAAKAEKLTSDLGIRFRFKSAMPDRAEKYRQYTIAANKKMKK